MSWTDTFNARSGLAQHLTGQMQNIQLSPNMSESEIQTKAAQIQSEIQNLNNNQNQQIQETGQTQVQQTPELRQVQSSSGNLERQPVKDSFQTQTASDAGNLNIYNPQAPVLNQNAQYQNYQALQAPSSYNTSQGYIQQSCQTNPIYNANYQQPNIQYQTQPSLAANAYQQTQQFAQTQNVPQTNPINYPQNNMYKSTSQN